MLVFVFSLRNKWHSFCHCVDVLFGLLENIQRCHFSVLEQSSFFTIVINVHDDRWGFGVIFDCCLFIYILISDATDVLAASILSLWSFIIACYVSGEHTLVPLYFYRGHILRKCGIRNDTALKLLKDHSLFSARRALICLLLHYRVNTEVWIASSNRKDLQSCSWIVSFHFT